MDDRNLYITKQNIISKSTVTDLWLAVIKQAISDIVKYKTTLKENITEEDIIAYNSANSFLFEDEHYFYFGEYKSKPRYINLSQLLDMLGCNNITSFRQYIKDTIDSKCLTRHRIVISRMLTAQINKICKYFINLGFDISNNKLECKKAIKEIDIANIFFK